MKTKIQKLITDSIETKKSLLNDDSIATIEQAAAAMIKSLKSGGKILAFGNGGSAADSQHIVAELVGRFKKERKALAAIALTTNTSVLTAIGNDYGYDVTFSRQVEALGKKGDAALGISTSGNSKNVIEAIRNSKKLGMQTIGLLGGDGGKLKAECDIAIVVGSKDTPRIQESHSLIGHILCELIEDGLFK